MAAKATLRNDDLAPYERAGPTMLARQPATIVEFKPPAQVIREWTDERAHYEARLSMMRSWRLSWQRHWALLALFILPRRNIWLTEGAGTQPTPNSMIRGDAINQNIVDSTGTQAMRVCSAGMVSGLTSPSRPWFKLKPTLSQGRSLDRAAQLWFDDVEDRMYAVMAGSNFYDSIAQMDEDIVVYGTAPMIVYEDEQDIIRCYNPCAGEYYLATSSAMRVESLYRQFVMTVAQIVEMFELENCPQEIADMWRQKGTALEKEYIVAHAIEPNFPIHTATGDVGVIKGDFTWREVYWLYGNASIKPLSKRGFKDPPHVSPRWAIQSNDPYGRSPGMDALPDIMQLQTETKRKAEAIEKMVRPPLLASVELKNEPSSILPGHVTYVAQLSNGQGMRPIYEVRPEIKEMMEDIREIQQRVERAFFKDIFMLVSEQSREMTAFEVAKRYEEKLQVLGPIIERFQNEALSPLIKRIFAIMQRKQMLPPLPKSLQGVPIQIEYVSMLALAQRAAATASMERIAGMVGTMEAVYPQVKDVMDPDEFLREYAELLNGPHRIMRAPEVVAQLRANAAKQQQAQAQLQMGMAAVQGAKTLSDTPVGSGGSALDLMMGTHGSQQPQGNA
jgi:hypothetical protein